MTKEQATELLKNRYNCEVYLSPWGINLYHKNLHGQISFNENKNYFEYGNIWEKNKQLWSTGEFARSDKLTFDQLYNVLDIYFPVNRQISLF